MEILNLPHEVLVHFFHSIDDVLLLLSLDSACKTFHSIISNQKYLWLHTLAKECEFDEDELKIWDNFSNLNFKNFLLKRRKWIHLVQSDAKMKSTFLGSVTSLFSSLLKSSNFTGVEPSLRNFVNFQKRNISTEVTKAFYADIEKLKKCTFVSYSSTYFLVEISKLFQSGAIHFAVAQLNLQFSNQEIKEICFSFLTFCLERKVEVEKNLQQFMGALGAVYKSINYPQETKALGESLKFLKKLIEGNFPPQFRSEQLFRSLFSLLQKGFDSPNCYKIESSIILLNREEKKRGSKYLHQFTASEIEFVLEHAANMIPLIFHIIEVGLYFHEKFPFSHQQLKNLESALKTTTNSEVIVLRNFLQLELNCSISSLTLNFHDYKELIPIVHNIVEWWDPLKNSCIHRGLLILLNTICRNVPPKFEFDIIQVLLCIIRDDPKEETVFSVMDTLGKISRSSSIKTFSSFETLLEVLRSVIPQDSRNEIWLDWLTETFASDSLDYGLHKELSIHKQGSTLHICNSKFEQTSFVIPYSIPQGRWYFTIKVHKGNELQIGIGNKYTIHLDKHLNNKKETILVEIDFTKRLFACTVNGQRLNEEEMSHGLIGTISPILNLGSNVDLEVNFGRNEKALIGFKPFQEVIDQHKEHIIRKLGEELKNANEKISKLQNSERELKRKIDELQTSTSNLNKRMQLTEENLEKLKK